MQMHFQVLRQGGNKPGAQGESLTVTLRDLSPFSFPHAQRSGSAPRRCGARSPLAPRFRDQSRAQVPWFPPRRGGCEPDIGGSAASLLSHHQTGSRSRPERRWPRPVSGSTTPRRYGCLSGKEVTVKSEGLCCPPTENSVGESTLGPPNAR